MAIAHTALIIYLLDVVLSFHSFCAYQAPVTFLRALHEVAYLTLIIIPTFYVTKLMLQEV